MSNRFMDTILQPGVAYAGHSATTNLEYGAQSGAMPRLGIVAKDGKHYGEWLSNAAYVSRNVIPIVLTTPRFFDYMPDSTKWIATYKSLMEAGFESFDGLSSGLTVDFEEHKIGADGNQQEELVRVSRERSTPTYVFREKQNKAVNRFWNYYIRYGMMDPDTQRPLVSQYLDLEEIGGMYTPDFFVGSVLYIEPDITHKQVIEAWLCVNMAPKLDGENTGKRDTASAGETKEYSIGFTAITINTEAVRRLADVVLKNLTVFNQIPDLNMTIPVNEIDPKVEAAKTGFNVMQ